MREDEKERVREDEKERKRERERMRKRDRERERVRVDISLREKRVSVRECEREIGKQLA